MQFFFNRNYGCFDKGLHKDLAFVSLHHDLRVTLSDSDVLRDCVCSTEEQNDLTASVRPACNNIEACLAVRCEQLLNVESGFFFFFTLLAKKRNIDAANVKC